MSDWVRGRDELREFLSYVALYAPDEFPEEDYLEAHELELQRELFGGP